MYVEVLLFYSAEKYFQSVQALLFLFRRIAILSLPKEKASWQLKALFGFCWITIHPLLPRPSGRPTGLTVVLNIIAIGGLSISFIPVATIWEPLLFNNKQKHKISILEAKFLKRLFRKKLRSCLDCQILCEEFAVRFYHDKYHLWQNILL